jgi:hypothetical protein
MLGSLFSAVVKTATLPIDIALDVVTGLHDVSTGQGVGNRTKDKIDCITEDLDNVL